MEKKGSVAFGEITIDFDRMELRRSGQMIPATSLEFRILKFFADNPECLFSREELISAVWRGRKRASRRTVDNSISHLRRKLGDDPARQVYFQTVYGAGYKFVLFGGTKTSRSVNWRRRLASDGRPEMRQPF
jgi:DNA-binding response OmpR family regulator